MRLHELRITAIGPFVEEQVIDFERLGASGLFLLEGPTGVGKSTVLDAVTFALYGSVTGASTDNGRLRSDFADPAATPRVQLELSVRGRRLRISRTPEYERPKRRGEGTVKERSTAHLEEWTEHAWKSLSFRQDEIGTIIGDHLGLTREQFRQVVLLPQGDFAAFLRADDDGRRAVLVKLFGTQFYERVMAVLQRRAAQARGELTASEADLSARIAAAWEAAALEPEDDPERPLTWGQQVADLESVQARIARQAREAGRLASDARAAEAAARQVAEEAREVAARVADRGDLVAELAATEAQRADQEHRQHRIAHAFRARPVRPLLDLLETARSRAAESLARLVDLGIGVAAEEAETEAARLREQAGIADRTAAGLQDVLVAEAGLDGARTELAGAEAGLASLQSQEEALVVRVAQLPDRRAELAGRLSDTRTEVAAGQLAAREIQSALRRCDAAWQVDELQTRLQEMQAVERAARRRYEAADHCVAVVLDQRLAGLQGELAAKLVSGDPCLVCGSVDHPAPAATDRQPVREEQLREAVNERDDAWAQWETSRGALAATQSQQAGARAVAEGLTPAESAARVAELNAVCESGSAAEIKLVQLLEEEVRLNESALKLQDELRHCTARLASSRTDVDRSRDSLASAEARVLKERQGHPSVAARCAALQERAGHALLGAQALEEHHRAGVACNTAHERALAEATSAGFAGLETAQQWVLDETELVDLEESVRAWKKRLEAVAAQLSTPSIQAVAAISAPLAARMAGTAETVLTEAGARARLLADRATRTQQSAELLDRLLLAVRKAADERAARAAASADLTEIEAYVRGNAGNPRMTLSTFVLRYWFEQVVAAANVRLQAMSNGKYELLRVEKGVRRSSRVGLGLAILDRHTGRERGTETLSGGESFYTSLSLALGLADVVVSEAGGAQLDTLFIDEGFGSLDPTTLDEVMSVIDELRGHGRVVGVVSHVSELKERISERLSIRRVRPDGPSCVQVVA